ncbi:hypothetical protein B0H17DRAFT_897904, partial [Mycena rosella]
QNHMGKHILLSQRGVVEANTVTEVAKDYPCGFCGQEISDAACKIFIGSGKAISLCSEEYQFMIKAALKPSGAKPCTNAPLKCAATGCKKVHWKYNMAEHLRARHPTWEETWEPTRRDAMHSLITLSHDEETRLGIP